MLYFKKTKYHIKSLRAFQYIENKKLYAKFDSSPTSAVEGEHICNHVAGKQRSFLTLYGFLSLQTTVFSRKYYSTLLEL